MAEEHSRVYTYKKTYACDHCRFGEMKSTNIMLTTNPPKFEHKCTNCGTVENLWQQYPLIYYEDEVRPHIDEKNAVQEYSLPA